MRNSFTLSSVQDLEFLDVILSYKLIAKGTDTRLLYVKWPHLAMVSMENMARTSPLLQDHTEYNASGMAVRNSMQLSKVVKLVPHH